MSEEAYHKIERTFYQCANGEVGIRIDQQCFKDGSMAYSSNIPWAFIYVDINQPEDGIWISPEEAVQLGQLLLDYGNDKLTGHDNG